MRKYLIGMTLALATSVAFSGIAQGAVTSQKLTVRAAPVKLDKKKRSQVGLDVTVDTTEAPPTPAAQTAAQTVLTFDRDFSLGNTGSMGQCNPTVLANTTTDGAKALCGAFQVGAGDSTVCSAAAGCGIANLPGVVTAFNGTESGGSSTIILHNRIGPPANATTILVGTLSGNVLTVQVPDTAATGLHLTHFFTSIPVLKTGVSKGKAAKKAKKKGKRKKKKRSTYYISARCSDRTWDFSETTTFRSGAPAQFAQTQIPCVQKKSKKKKRKKK